MIELTEQEQIARHYAACLDSCNLINGGKPEKMEAAEWAATVERNKEHLVLMLTKGIFDGYALTPLQEAAA